MSEIIVRVLNVEPTPGSTIWIGTGITAEGTLIKFAGDWRPMSELREVLDVNEKWGSPAIRVALEGWQIIGKLDNQTRSRPE